MSHKTDLPEQIEAFIPLVDDYLAKSDLWLATYKQWMRPQEARDGADDSLTPAIIAQSESLDGIRKQIIPAGKQLINNISAAGNEVQGIRQLVNKIEKSRRVESLDEHKELLGIVHDLWDQVTEKLQNMVPGEPQPPLETTHGTTNNRPKATVHERMLGYALKNQEAMSWTTKKWAEHLKCGRSTVAETAAWKLWKALRDKAGAENALSQRGRNVLRKTTRNL